MLIPPADQPGFVRLPEMQDFQCSNQDSPGQTRVVGPTLQ